MEPRAPLRLLACEDGRDLAERVALRLGMALTPSRDVWFACGEGKHVIDDNVRGTDVYVFQRPIVPGSAHTVYDRLMMLLHTVDAARHADAERITVVMPYLVGGRQDKRKNRAREGVTTGLLARLLDAAGVSMVLTVEPHNEATSGCFDPTRCVLEPVYLTNAFARWLKAEGLAGDLVASTDVGGLALARRFAKVLERDIVALSKERDYSRPNQVACTTVIGDVRGRRVLIVDDIVDTAGSAVAAVQALWQNGATDVVLATVHPVLSAPAWERLAALRREAEERGVGFQVAGTSSVVHPGAPAWYRSFAIEGLLADVIRTVNQRGSVHTLTEAEEA
jgi:ribose-phosphate pyrophosphokinase